MDTAKTVLVIDDDHDITTHVRWALEKTGMRADVAHTALEGLAAARRERPALILMDIRMPGMDGALMAELLKESEGLQDIPIILMSAMPEEELRTRAQRSGAFSFIPKPLSLKRLADEVGRCLRESAATEVLGS